MLDVHYVIVGGGSAKAMLSYLCRRSGLMTIVPVEAMGYLPSHPDLPFPEIKLSFGLMVSNPATHKPSVQPGVVIYANVARPKRGGEIRLRSADPHDEPVIDHRLLGDADDALVSGVKQVQKIMMKTGDFAPFRAGCVWPAPPPATDIRSAPAGWAATMPQSSIPACAYGALPDCWSQMRRSCRSCRPPTPARYRS